MDPKYAGANVFQITKFTMHSAIQVGFKKHIYQIVSRQYITTHIIHMYVPPNCNGVLAHTASNIPP